MLELEELVNKLRGLDRVAMAYKTGVSLSTINKLLSGENTNPTFAVIAALHNYLESKNELSQQGDKAGSEAPDADNRGKPGRG